MRIERVIDLESKLRARVNQRLQKGELTKYETVDGYVAVDLEEYENLPRKKRGRPIKRTGGKQNG